MPNVIGTPVETYELHVRRNSVHGFVLEWYKDKAKTIPDNDISGRTFRVLIGQRTSPVKTWEAIASGNEATFVLSQEDSDLPFNRYDGSILMVEGAQETALINLRVIVEPD
jgi:hypothetical protein